MLNNKTIIIQKILLLLFNLLFLISSIDIVSVIKTKINVVNKTFVINGFIFLFSILFLALKPTFSINGLFNAVYTVLYLVFFICIHCISMLLQLYYIRHGRILNTINFFYKIRKAQDILHQQSMH